MFTIRYHDKIPDDLARIAKANKVRIKKAIEQKLMNDPVVFGKPLQNSLRGFRTIRVSEYRIIFLIQKEEVSITIIGHCSIVYGLAEGRD